MRSSNSFRRGRATAGRGERSLDDVARDRRRRMKRLHMIARRTSDRAQPIAIRERRPGCAGQLAGLHIVIDGVNAVGQRPVSFDARPAHQRSGAADRRFVDAEGLPSEPLRRPDEMRPRTSREIRLEWQRRVGDVDRVAFARARPRARRSRVAAPSRNCGRGRRRRRRSSFLADGGDATSRSAAPNGSPSEIGRSFAMRSRLRSTPRNRGVGTRRCAVLANTCQWSIGSSRLK